MTTKWIYPGMHSPIPDTTRPAIPIPKGPDGSGPSLTCPTCGKINCGCGPKQPK